MSIKSTIKETKKKIESMRKELQKEVNAAFHEEAKKLFEEHPDLVGFRWTQYTPYFNDGDTCTFGAHTDHPFIKFKGREGGEDGDDDCEGGYEEFYVYKDEDKGSPFEKAGNAVQEFLSAFDDDDYEHLFGDHAKITVTRMGVRNEEYSHD